MRLVLRIAVQADIAVSLTTPAHEAGSIEKDAFSVVAVPLA